MFQKPGLGVIQNLSKSRWEILLLKRMGYAKGMSRAVNDAKLFL